MRSNFSEGGFLAIETRNTQSPGLAASIASAERHPTSSESTCGPSLSGMAGKCIKQHHSCSVSCARREATPPCWVCKGACIRCDQTRRPWLVRLLLATWAFANKYDVKGLQDALVQAFSDAQHLCTLGVEFIEKVYSITSPGSPLRELGALEAVWLMKHGDKPYSLLNRFSCWNELRDDLYAAQATYCTLREEVILAALKGNMRLSNCGRLGLIYDKLDEGLKQFVFERLRQKDFE